MEIEWCLSLLSDNSWTSCKIIGRQPFEKNALMADFVIKSWRKWMKENEKRS